ncbi:MAG: BrnT family toxin [Acidimicrobiia bacterium]|nr:BrnT family toxin [Acidimicrobiia bacterium]
MTDEVGWDPRKAAANLKKHGVDFADAATVLHDEQAITVREDEEGEERYATVGMDALGNVLVVVYTWRNDKPRLISARKVRVP